MEQKLTPRMQYTCMHNLCYFFEEMEGLFGEKIHNYQPLTKYILSEPGTVNTAFGRLGAPRNIELVNLARLKPLSSIIRTYRPNTKNI